MACLMVFAVGTASGADVENCEAMLERAEQIRQMREHDAVAGVDAANDWLDEAGPATRQACPQAVAQMFRARATNLTVLGELRAALEDIEYGMNVLDASEADFPREVAALHLAAGVAHWELEQHDLAVGHYLQAIQLNEQLGDIEGMARAAGNLGNLYNTLGNFDQARTYHLRALDGFEQAGNQVAQAGTLLNLAALDYRQGAIARREGRVEHAPEFEQSALDLGRQALALFETLENPLGIAIASNSVASTLNNLGKHEQALDYYQRALEIRRAVGERLGIAQSKLDMGRAMTRLGRFSEAGELFDAAEPLIPDDISSLAADWLEARVELAEAQGDHRLALAIHRDLLDMRIAIAEDQVALRVEAKRLDFESERQTQQVELLQSEATIRELELARQRITSFAAIAVAGALLVPILLLWRLNRQGRRLGRALEVAARTDALTGLANRREMDRRIADFLASGAIQPERTAALILIDADDFKRINDRLGHLQGDEVLTRLAEVLRDTLGQRGQLARWGGEEFLVMAPDHDPQAAHELAETLRGAVTQAGIRAGNQLVTITLGVTLLKANEAIDPALARADRALYRGKHLGKNRVAIDSEH